MEKLNKLKFIEKVSEGLQLSDDLKVWDHYWWVDEEESMLYMTENLWTNNTEAYNAGVTSLKLSPGYYNKDNMYTYVPTINSNEIVFLLSLYNDKNIGYSLTE